MEESDKTQEFTSANAELLEAISHPLRIKILQMLNEKSLNFKDLQKEVGTESEEQLSFHLTKLEGLVKETPEGAYTLTGDGKEALWGIQSMGSKMKEEESDAI